MSRIRKWTGRNSPFFVSDRDRAVALRRARCAPRVNSLGVGGTNAHVVLEEAPAAARGAERHRTARCSCCRRDRRPPSIGRRPPRGSSRAEDGRSISMTWRSRWRPVDADSPSGVPSSPRRRKRRSPRCALATPRRWLGANSTQPGTKVAFLFPGGGAQYPGMAADLYKSEPVFRARVDGCLEILRAHESIDLRPLMFPAGGAEARSRGSMLLRPSLALPALLTIELAVADLLRVVGRHPGRHARSQHGRVRGGIPRRRVLAARRARGRHVPRHVCSKRCQTARCSRFRCPKRRCYPELLPGLSFAASNGPGLCLVSGEVAAIAELESRLQAAASRRGVCRLRLRRTRRCSTRFSVEFEAYLRTLRLSEPTLPFVSNVTGTWITPDEARDPGTGSDTCVSPCASPKAWRHSLPTEPAERRFSRWVRDGR